MCGDWQTTCHMVGAETKAMMNGRPGVTSNRQNFFLINKYVTIS